MNEDIIIPIIIDPKKGLSEARGFGVKVNNALSSIQGWKNGKIELFLNIKDANGAAKLHSLGTAAKVADDGFKKLRVGAAQADNALLNFSRVVQDSPYGIIGMANNFNPLLESFQRLRKETGSAGGALKALAGSMLGGGGLGLAIGAIGAALSFATIGLQMWTRGSKGAKGATDELTESYKQQASNIAKQITTLTALVGITQSSTSSLEDKKNAILAINQEYKEYLGILGKEGVTLRNVAAAYDLVIDKMLKQAVVKGLQDEISKEVEKTAQSILLLERAEKKRKDGIAAANKPKASQADVMEHALKTYGNYNKAVSDGHLALIKQGQAIGVAREQAFSYEGRLKSLKDELVATVAPMLALTDKFDDLGIKLNTPKKTGLSAAAKEAEQFAESQTQLVDQIKYLNDSYRKGFLTTLDYATQKYQLLSQAAQEFQVKFNQPADSALIKSIDEQLTQLRATIRSVELKDLGPIFDKAAVSNLGTLKNKSGKAVSLAFPIDPVIATDNNFKDRFNRQLELYQEGISLGVRSFRWKGETIPFSLALDPKQMEVSIQQAKQHIELFNNVVNTAAIDGLSALGEGLGNTVNRMGSLGDIFSGVGKVIGGAMVNFGKELIKGALVIVVAKQAIKALLANPVLAIGAGVALIAAGTAIKNSLGRKSRQQIGGYADGGAALGGHLAWVGESPRTNRTNPELMGRFDQWKNVLVNQAREVASKAYMAMRPAQQQNFGDMRFVLEQDVLVAYMRRGQNRQSRNY